MHRWVWDLRPTLLLHVPLELLVAAVEDLVPATVLPGTYTVRLTVGSQTYTQPLVVRRDPREK